MLQSVRSLEASQIVLVLLLKSLFDSLVVLYCLLCGLFDFIFDQILEAQRLCVLDATNLLIDVEVCLLFLLIERCDQCFFDCGMVVKV